MTAPTPDDFTPAGISIGVVGVGLMGSSIVAALLMAGHPVKAVAPLAEELKVAPAHIKAHLMHCNNAGLLHQPVDVYLNNFIVSGDYAILANCRMVLECVTEKPDIKKQVYANISAVVADDTVIASNTSAIPISMLQSYVPHPGRFLGVHWAEPAYMTRFLEITCGRHTDMQFARWAFTLAHQWDKEPTLLKKDIRGFVTNRLMYAIYREALALEENGDATIEDMDKAFRYDAGSWMTLMGLFRRIDYIGLDSLCNTVKNIFPQLNNSDGIPAAMQRMMDLRAKGTKTAKGFYNYPGNEGQKWEEAFAEFNKDIDRLAAGYPSKDSRIE